ncbi:DUF1993 family protein [Cupriavidus sp. CuC1]|uniref:DUF1993 family protein n=1 Tax=Cupriavidus sp. CuC1 TaxID=3373131 RepID=UPI0037CEB25A
MTLSIHSAIVGDYIKMLRNLQAWLDKAQAHADARKFDSAGYLSMKLAPDMLPLSRQVLIAGEIAKVGVERFAGLTAPKVEHEDASVQDLRQRVQGIIDHLAACTPAQIDGSTVTELVVPQRGKAPLVFDRQGFVHWSQANFFFHVTMTYALLRHAGVELGKADFLGLG